MPDLHRGLGARLDTPTRAEKRAQLLDMALGVFTSAGVVHLRVQREADVSNLGDLLLYSLDDLEDIAAEKGGIRQLLDEKWRKVYQGERSTRTLHQGRDAGRISEDITSRGQSSTYLHTQETDKSRLVEVMIGGQCLGDA